MFTSHEHTWPQTHRCWRKNRYSGDFLKNVVVVCDEEGDNLYVANKTEANVQLGPLVEIFGLGAGAFAGAKDAEES